MKKHIIKSLFVTALASLTVSSCSQPEYLNPSSASETQVVNSVDGLLALCNGLAYRYSVGRQSPVYASITGSGLTNKSLKVLNAGNTDEDALEKGAGSVDQSNAVVSNLWSYSNLVKSNADMILRNASISTDPNMKASIVAYASIFRALALGNLAQFWQQAPIVVADKASFNNREDVLKQAISSLETAQAGMQSVTIPGKFSTKVIGGIDMVNTINALIARYSLMLGDNDKALAAASKVDLSKRSEFRYGDTADNRNPIFETALGNVNVYQPLDLNMGLPAALKPATEDKRIDFYFLSRTPSQNTYRGKGFFTAYSSPIPVYLPGEVSLIKAEAYARKDDLNNAVTELNNVLTKKTDVWGIGADLPAYSGDKTKDQILTEIYRNRRIELFMSGLELEDSRRFGRPAAGTANAERTRNWYPFPRNERENNPNTPADPSI